MSTKEDIFCVIAVGAIGIVLYYMGAKPEAVTVLTGLNGALIRHIVGSANGKQPPAPLAPPSAPVPPMENGNVTK